MRGPDFLVVGAPKCGTTALHSYLTANPRLFLAPKEPEFFGSDLTYRTTRMSRQFYEAMFPHSDDRLRGDVSVWYLFSRFAAQEIHDFNPDARIIIMLRSPIDQMYSLHSQLLFTVDENEPSFSRALQLESKRKQGKALPRITKIPFATQYREIATFSVQIQRYLRVFRRDQIHFILLEDLRTDPTSVWDRLHAFLGVDPADRPEMAPLNMNKSNKFRAAATSAAFARRVLVPQLGLRRLPRPIKTSLGAAYRSVMRWNPSHEPRSEMDPQLRRELVEEFSREITELEGILDRRLSHWRN